MKSLFTPSLSNLSISYLSICIPPSRNPPFRLLRQFEFLNIKNSSAFRKSDRMTGRQEYDRTKDRQRILGKYMIDANICVLQVRFQSWNLTIQLYGWGYAWKMPWNCNKKPRRKQSF
jgi:hypothetical protein